MILRRITKHVYEQNWFAVGLDMMVVIVGIFVGLQISNWNVDPQNAAKGDSYLVRITEELEQDIRFFDNVISSNERSMDNARFLLDTLKNEVLVREDPTRFITSLAFVGSSFVVNVSNNTIEEIKFSGNLELITDEELRNDIIDYYDFIEVSENFSHLRLDAETEYQKRIAGVLEPHQSEFGSDLRYNEDEAIIAFEKFKQKKDLIEWIPIVMNNKRGTIAMSTQSRRNAQELVDLIRSNAN
ncbi:MAG: hypothetical protein P8H03_02370 [Emcibacteraceae bacterium]|nr:hypothetical protein [Emcibacteraceae bacterium]